MLVKKCEGASVVILKMIYFKLWRVCWKNHRSQDHKIIRSGYKSCRKEVCLGIPKRDTAQDPINFMKTALNGLNGSEMSIPYPPIYRPTKNKSRNIEKKTNKCLPNVVRWCPMAANKHRNSRQNLSKQDNPALLFFLFNFTSFYSFGDKNIKYLLFTLSRGIWYMFWWHLAR